MAFLKSFFAGIVVLAVAMLAKSVLVRALQMNAAGASPPPTGTRAAVPASDRAPAPARFDPRAPPQGRHDEPEDMLDAVINVRRIEGKINAASTKRLAELLQRHPDLAAQAMRRWLAQGNDSR